MHSGSAQERETRAPTVEFGRRESRENLGNHLRPFAAAVGILFHAKKNRLLAVDLQRQRERALEKFDNARETTVSIAGLHIGVR